MGALVQHAGSCTVSGVARPPKPRTEYYGRLQAGTPSAVGRTSLLGGRARNPDAARQTRARGGVADRGKPGPGVHAAVPAAGAAGGRAAVPDLGDVAADQGLVLLPGPAGGVAGGTGDRRTVPLRSCVRRGAAIDLVVDRARENRSQIVFTTARGRDAVFWQSPRTRKQARPNVRTPTARAAGIAELQIVVDSHEQYAYRFATQQVTTKQALPCGDYGVAPTDGWSPVVERKSLVDLVSSLTGGKLRYQVAELAALPRAAVVVEDRYSQVFKLDRVRPALVADGLAELQVRWPNVPIVFCETRQLAEEWTYRFLAAAHAWAITEHAALQRISPITIDITELDQAPAAPKPPTAEVRAWARAAGLPVPDRGRLRPDIWAGLARRQPTELNLAPPPRTTLHHQIGHTPVTRNEVCIKPGMPQRWVSSLTARAASTSPSSSSR